MSWDWLNIVGTVAFATSGAIVAMEEGYDLLGVVFLGLATAFGGGVLRNVLLGQPVTMLWAQEGLLGVAALATLIVFVLPRPWLRRWLSLEVFFDAFGLAAFSVQAALIATQLRFPLIAVLVAALLTGCGGGIVRDVLAHRKPLVFQPGIVYGIWAIGAGLAVHLGWPRQGWPVALLVTLVAACRLVAYHRRWSLPYRSDDAIAEP
jgi:uncharacterized membrane protein YeiH